MGEKIITNTYDALTPDEQIAFLERENAEFAKYLAIKRAAYNSGKTRRAVLDLLFKIAYILTFLLIAGLPFYGLFI